MFSSEELTVLREKYREADSYLTFSSDTTRAVLEEIIAHPYFPGGTDPFVLAFLGSLLKIIEPERVLQLGTYIGFSAIYMADILRSNRRVGHLVTVEPEALHHRLAREWVAKAGLQNNIAFLDGYSTDPEINTLVQTSGPFDLIYLDSSHSYQATLEEMDRILNRPGWLKRSGLLLLHDAGVGAQQWDVTNQGGVRQALVDWLAGHYENYYHLIFEPPLWPNACGLGIVAHRGHNDETQKNSTRQQIKELNDAIASKERHIAQLEEHIHRINAGRVMRLMNWLQSR